MGEGEPGPGEMTLFLGDDSLPPGTILTTDPPERRGFSHIQGIRLLTGHGCEVSHQRLAPGPVQTGESARSTQELLRGPVFDDPTSLHDKNPAGNGDSGESMSNDDGCAVSEESF